MSRRRQARSVPERQELAVTPLCCTALLRRQTGSCSTSSNLGPLLLISTAGDAAGTPVRSNTWLCVLAQRNSVSGVRARTLLTLRIVVSARDGRPSGRSAGVELPAHSDASPAHAAPASLQRRTRTPVAVVALSDLSGVPLTLGSG